MKRRIKQVLNERHRVQRALREVGMQSKARGKTMQGTGAEKAVSVTAGWLISRREVTSFVVEGALPAGESLGACGAVRGPVLLE